MSRIVSVCLLALVVELVASFEPTTDTEVSRGSLIGFEHMLAPIFLPPYKSFWNITLPLEDAKCLLNVNFGVKVVVHEPDAPPKADVTLVSKSQLHVQRKAVQFSTATVHTTVYCPFNVGGEEVKENIDAKVVPSVAGMRRSNAYPSQRRMGNVGVYRRSCEQCGRDSLMKDAIPVARDVEQRADKRADFSAIEDHKNVVVAFEKSDDVGVKGRFRADVKPMAVPVTV